MGDIFEPHTQEQFSVISDQPTLGQEPMESDGKKISQVKATIDRWSKEVIEKIKILRKELDQFHLEKETLIQEADRLKYELAISKGKFTELEQQLTETLEIFNQTMIEIEQTLKTDPEPPNITEEEPSRSFFGDPKLKNALSEW